MDPPATDLQALLASYDLFWERYKTAATPQEEQRYLFSLGNFQDRGLLQRTLDAAVQSDAVQMQNDNPNIDAAAEDSVLGDELYRIELRDFVRRLDSLHGVHS